MSGNDDNLSLTQQGYDAFARGDMTALAELLAPDVQWFVGGENALSGRYSGRDATFEYFGKLLRLTGGSITVEVLALTEPMPDTVIALVRVHAEGNGMEFDEDAVQQIEFRHGLATACRSFLQNGQVFDALVGPAVITLNEQERVTSP
jgi:hypothetical protein